MIFYYLVIMQPLLCFILLFACSIPSFSQKKWDLDKNSIVKDSSGRQYKYEEWAPMLRSREYVAVVAKPDTDSMYFVLQHVTDEMRKKWLINSKPPKESAYFTTGKPFPTLKTKTITGEKINTRDLKGKILVINYWFINCMPCRKEIPVLNELVRHFEGDTSVVFISIAKDSNRDLKEFLETTPFSYKVIGYGEGSQGIGSFPTNVVVDKEGKIVFHASGYSPVTVYWIGKKIGELTGEKAEGPQTSP